MICFFFPQWLPVRFHFCHRRGFTVLYILHTQVRGKYFECTGFSFFHTFWFFGLLLALPASMTCHLCCFSGICHFMFLENLPVFSCWVFCYQSLVPFRQMLLFLFSSFLFAFAFVLIKKFLFFLFCLLLLVLFIVPLTTRYCTYQVVYICYFLPKVLQFHLFHLSALSSYCFTSVLGTLAFWTSVVGPLYATLLEGLPSVFP